MSNFRKRVARRQLRASGQTSAAGSRTWHRRMRRERHLLAEALASPSKGKRRKAILPRLPNQSTSCEATPCGCPNQRGGDRRESRKSARSARNSENEVSLQAPWFDVAQFQVQSLKITSFEVKLKRIWTFLRVRIYFGSYALGMTLSAEAAPALLQLAMIDYEDELLIMAAIFSGQ